MAASKLHRSMESSRSPDGFQGKAVSPCNQLVAEAEEPVTLTPSAFLKEMSLTTQQRLATARDTRRPHIVQLLDMSETSHQKFSAVDLDQSLFQPFPSEVVFQSYVPCEVYEVPLVLRNNDMVPRLVKVVLESSPYFKLISPTDVCRKVAPGMPSTFHILFTPEENKDYFHELTCITEREKFIVPIRAIGARAILDFPDQLNFSVCPVKHSTQRTLLVRNIGNREARYHISTQSPFSVDPSVGTLGIGDTMQVTVEFHPLKTGDHSSSLQLHYDTGEYVHTRLYGAAVDVNIRLDRNSLTIEKTYLTLANRRSVVIHNRSEIIAHFQWKAFVTQEEEDQHKLRLCGRLQQQEEGKIDRFIEECAVDPTLRERLTVLSRIFHNKRAKVRGDSMLFSDNIFTVEPVEGDIWPNSSAEINVIFEPREARVYQQTIFCDISGRETRLPLRVKGEGEGPRLRFSFDQLDIGKVFVGSAHSYEAVLFNKGAIDALFNLMPPTTALGSCFTFLPREGILMPDELQVIHISFSSTILGQFSEEFRFSVYGSPEPVTLTIRGCVIGPTFHFDVPSLRFGDVPFGELGSQETALKTPSVSSFVQMSDNTRLSWRKGAHGDLKPSEFTITPCRGTVRSQGLLDIQVTLCSNTVRQYELALVVDVDGVGKEVLALLLTARCVVPPLRVLNPTVKFGRCFLKHPYQQELTLVNDSDVPGCYGLLPQHKEGAAVWYSSPAPCGIIQPRSSVQVPVVLAAQVTGEQCTAAELAVFGREGAPLKIHLVSTGEGPVVYVHPSKIDFGNIQVLQDATRILNLSNQAVIPASFWAEMVGKGSRWRIEPSRGEIPAGAEVFVAVIANLDDTKKFKDKVKLCIENSNTYVIPVQAVGTGTTIVTDKPFAPALTLGPHFSLSPCCYHFKITNKGRRTHQLYWTTEGFAPFRQHDRLPAVGNTKGKNSSQRPQPTSPVFKLRPLRMELMPGRTMEMMLEGSSSTPKVVTERLLCHAIIGNKAGKAQIMQVDVTCEFVAPVLQFSSREITFRVEKQPSDVLTLQYEPLHLKNISSLPLSFVLLLDHPFLICDAEQQPLSAGVEPMKLGVGEELHLSIRFDPAYKEDLNIRIAEKALKIQFLEHPQEDQVTVRGEVYFPNLHIQTMALDFGCILNDTEDVRYIEMTNCSPLLVRYRWAFLTGSHMSEMRYVPLCPLLKALLLPGGLSVLWPLQPRPSLQAEAVELQPRSRAQGAGWLLCIHPGPTYEVNIVLPLWVSTHLLSSLQLFNEVTEAELTLQNSGKVGFKYQALSPSTAPADSPLPGVPLVLPSTGYIGPGKEQVLKISYLPGVPGVFCKTFQIQVGHLEPEKFTLKGEGSFPRIYLDLPRNIKGKRCPWTQERLLFFSHVVHLARTKSGGFRALDTRLQMRLEEMLIEEHALEQQELIASCPPEDAVFDQRARRRLLRAQLPEYILDFGYVVLGNIPAHIVKVTNTGQFPVSFHADGRVLRDSGFAVELDRVRNLPYCETETFEVRFDPQSASVPLGAVDVLLPIKVAGGPTFHICLRATVTLPSLSLSRDRLEFCSVQCGQCREETIQLHNQFQVPCKWFITITEPVDKHLPASVRRKLQQEAKAKPCVFEALPLAGDLAPGERCNVRVRFSPTEERSYRSELKVNICQSSQHFQLPVSGHGLEPQLEFNPSVLELGPVLPYSNGAEGTVVVKNPCEFPIEFYSLEFDQQYLAEEQILRVLKEYDCHNTLLLPPRAPGEKLPPEVLEYYQDQKRLQDEQGKPKLGEPAGQDNGEALALAALRVGTAGGPAHVSMNSFSAEAGFSLSLPGHLLHHLPSLCPSSSANTEDIQSLSDQGGKYSSTSSKDAAGELDDSPVCRAIARHLGLDISAEGRAAQNRRGIVIIIHGAPLTGKTSAAVALSRRYGAACLTIDSVVTEAISDRSSSAGLRARELCLRAAIEQSHKETEDAGKASESCPSHPLLLPLLNQHSVGSRSRASAATGKRKMDGHGSQSQKQQHTDLAGSWVMTPVISHLVSLLPCFPSQQWLSVGGSGAGEMGLMSCVLPEDLLGAILSERLQLSDCYQGVVFDGLETLFAGSMASALICLLKAARNRPHIYFVNLFQDYASLKAREAAAKEQEEREQEEAARREKARLQEMDEEEYDALTEEQKAQFDDSILHVQRERKKRKMEQLARELEEKLKQELERLREEEEMKKKSRRGKRELGKEKDSALGKKSQHGGRQVGGCVYREEKSPKQKDNSLSCTTPQEATHFCARGWVPGRGNMGLASSCQDTALASVRGKGNDPSSSAAAFSPSMGRYKAQNYPSNCEKITILNTTSLEAEVHFFFEHDLKADTFLLDPPSMTLKPNEKQELSLWAYPTSAGLIEDNLVCCVKENPEPVVFPLCCQGVRVELGVSPKQVHFDKLLLHRRDSKKLVLRNSNPLPAAWRLSGLENLGEDFSVSQDEGVVGPCTELEVYLHFMATKALSVKKTIRLEVSDAENILGIVQIENIQIHAEAYDVALSITIPKGTDGNVDFGVLKVLDDTKQALTLKNKGKYEITYRWVAALAAYLASHFSIQPPKGMLTVSERPVQVQLLFHPKAEISIEDKPILKCQVIEPSLCDGGETIAIIPVRVSAKALFSKYSIAPASFINFGALVNGTKKTCAITLENRGSLDFKFLVCRADQDVSGLARKRPGGTVLSGDAQGRAASPQPLPGLFLQARFTVGMFTVYPGFGSIHPGDEQTITVDCHAEPLGPCEEHLSIDISDRDPSDNPLGIPYTLLAESCLPAFVADDVGSIFEEHRICSNTNLCQILQTMQDKGVFITDENKFIFTNVLVGHRAAARFKIRNVGKVPCNVVLSIRPISGKPNSRISDVFEVDPVQMCVPSRSHAFATVTFTPQTMQSYQCTFEASLDAQTSLTFDISGEGNLPRVTVLRPVLHSKGGNPLLLFKKLLLGDSEKLPLVLHNAGGVPVQVMIDLLDEGGAFFLRARPTTQCIYQAAGMKEDSAGEGTKPHTASLVLHRGESAEFDVLFKPSLPQRVEGKIHLSVVDNPYEETNIQLVGEGYEDDFTIDNIHGLVADSAEESTEETSEAVRADHIQFGDCHIGKPYQATFTITNRSQAEAMRFEWPAGPPFHFSPQVGHLHAGCTKDITVTLKSDVPVTFRRQPVRCKVARIAFQLPPEQVTDWDDRLRTVKWVDTMRGQAATWPVKKKVIETDPEPAHSLLERSSREVELRLSAVVDYAEFKLDTDAIQFKETLLFQTRTFTFQLSNTGNVALEYTWMEDVGDERAASRAGDLLLTTLKGKALALHGNWVCPVTVCATSLFSVEPRSGTIPAGQEQLFQMKFSPVYVGDFESRMLCSIPNLKPNQKGPEMIVKGRSQMPFCHFELEDSDYITAERRSPELQDPKGTTLGLNTRVVEFAAIGVRSRNSRTFMVMNPTSSAYSFQWTCQDPAAPPGQTAFFCLTERGQIQPGKKAEVGFEFIPRHLDITESFWVFTIPEQCVSVPFLLVGNTTDPLVTLDRSHLNFHLLLVGHKVHQTIYMINSEKEAFSFAFRESSLFSEGCNTFVKIEPLEGSIAPLSRLPITVYFTPTLEGEVVFNLKCDVKKKMEPLCLNIKANGYSTSVSVRCEHGDGRSTELSTQDINIIDFEEVQLNKSTKCVFSIHNSGKFGFSFSWELSGPAARVQHLTLVPQTGNVQAESKVETQLVFHPLKMCSLKDVELTLQISQGPTFTCMFLATVVVPTIHFSATRLNFGACFVYQAGMPPAQQTLVITNKADKDVSLSCLFAGTAYLEVGCPECILRPGGAVEVPVTFYPREVASYQELIRFEINGLYHQTVEIQGRGTEMKGVENLSSSLPFVVKLGSVTIANNSLAPLTFELSFKSSVPELQEHGVLCLHPTGELNLKPKGDTCKVEVVFSPKRRIQPFAGEVMLESKGLARSLFMVRGSCQGIHVSLDQEHLNFGAVLQQSQASQRIVMQNTGDIGVKFRWDVKSFKPDFSISPTKGYISPGMDVPFVVSFHPLKPSLAIQYEGLQCFIQGSEPLRLTLAGCCLEAPVSKETLMFACDVRETHSQTVLLSNPSNEACTVKPIIEGEHWKGPEFFHLEANEQNKPYKITYNPLTMSSDKKKHQGSIFFPLPDGTGLHYLLQGTAEGPKCSGTIVREVPCRTSYTELIPVSNWLSRPQRFLVVMDILKPENLESGSMLRGLEYIDVPGSDKKDYKLTFLSYKEGVFSAMVTFLNEVTEEYLFYMITFKATAPGPVGTVEVSAAVRQSVSSAIRVDNPLAFPVVFDVDCKVPDLSVPPHFSVPARAEVGADLVIEYRPLKVGESTGRLTLHSSDLGSCHYELSLKATASKPEKPLYFCTTLGSNQTLTAKVMNYSRQRTDYVLQTDCPDFQTEKAISMPPAGVGGSEVCVEVTYEPCQLGESRATLRLSGPPGGEYSIPLFGLALPPKPQGPFLVKTGGSTSIPFKNVFLQPTAFTYSVENPAFAVRATGTLRPKKTIFMAVSFEGSPGGGRTPVSSRLVVSCPRAAGVGSGVSWVYYLRGLPTDK
uniref:HYDIN protein n=1 Tax=Cairina moschata TaxID=8855 RepID=A0A8C3CDK8_CAIMO